MEEKPEYEDFFLSRGKSLFFPRERLDAYPACSSTPILAFDRRIHLIISRVHGKGRNENSSTVKERNENSYEL